MTTKNTGDVVVEKVPAKKAVPSTAVLQARIDRRTKLNEADQALLDSILAKRNERESKRLGSIEEQIAKLTARRDAIARTEAREAEAAEAEVTEG